MPTIFDYVNATEVANFYTDSPYNSMSYLGEELFPARKQVGLDLSWIKGSKGLPIMLKPSAFDTKATLRDRAGFSKVLTEMPFFREAMRIGERDRQEMNKFLAGNNVSMIQPILANIYDDAGKLVESSKVSAEVMRMQLISTGAISITDNRMVYDYDYNMPSENITTVTSGEYWDLATAPVIDHLTAWQDQIEETTGERPTRMVCNRETFKLLRINNVIKTYAYPGLDTAKVNINDNDIKRVLLDVCGISVAIYSKKYNNASGVATYFYPTNKITLMPASAIGNTWYGTTPEESDLMGGATDAEVRIVNTGIAVTSVKEAHPVNVQTIVSGIFLPSGENVDSLFIATVNA